MPLLLYLKLVRPLNLIMMASILLLTFRLVTIPSITEANSSSRFLALVVLASVCVMAAGNVINDIYDIIADRHNKPERWYVGNSISVPNAYRFYYILCAIALLTISIIYTESSNAILVSIFLGTMILLHSYSSLLKKIPVLGNTIVSFLCALSLWIVPIAFIASNVSGKIPKNAVELLAFLSVFAFLLTFIREIVKDYIDSRGDKIAGVVTLAHKVSSTQLRFLLLGSQILVLALLISTILLHTEFRQPMLYYIYGLIVSGSFLLYVMNKEFSLAALKRVSQYLKLYMIQGIIALAFA